MGSNRAVQTYEYMSEWAGRLKLAILVGRHPPKSSELWYTANLSGRITLCPFVLNLHEEQDKRSSEDKTRMFDQVGTEKSNGESPVRFEDSCPERFARLSEPNHIVTVRFCKVFLPVRRQLCRLRKMRLTHMNMPLLLIFRGSAVAL